HDERAIVNRQRITFNEHKVLTRAEAFTQQRDQLTIKLKRHDAPCLLDKARRQSAPPRPDLDHSLSRRRRKLTHDPRCHALIREKILTEPFLRHKAEVRGQRSEVSENSFY